MCASPKTRAAVTYFGCWLVGRGGKPSGPLPYAHETEGKFKYVNKEQYYEQSENEK